MWFLFGLSIDISLLLKYSWACKRVRAIEVKQKKKTFKNVKKGQLFEKLYFYSLTTKWITKSKYEMKKKREKK